MAENTDETKKKPKIKVYTAAHCEGCQEVKEMLEKGQFTVDGEEGEVDLVDIETEEGFAEATKRDDLTGVPAAFKDAKVCKIKIDDENHIVMLECEGDGEVKAGSGS
jgi:glutaredoxin